MEGNGYLKIKNIYKISLRDFNIIYKILSRMRLVKLHKDLFKYFKDEIDLTHNIENSSLL